MQYFVAAQLSPQVSVYSRGTDAIKWFPDDSIASSVKSDDRQTLCRIGATRGRFNIET